MILRRMEGDQRARRFYEKCGWFLDGARDNMTLDGTQVPVVRYRLLTTAPAGRDLGCVWSPRYRLPRVRPKVASSLMPRSGSTRRG